MITLVPEQYIRFKSTTSDYIIYLTYLWRDWLTIHLYHFGKCYGYYYLGNHCKATHGICWVDHPDFDTEWKMEREVEALVRAFDCYERLSGITPWGALQSDDALSHAAP